MCYEGIPLQYTVFVVLSLIPSQCTKYQTCLLARVTKDSLGLTNEQLCYPVSVLLSSCIGVVTVRRKLSMPDPVLRLEFVKQC